MTSHFSGVISWATHHDLSWPKSQLWRSVSPIHLSHHLETLPRAVISLFFNIFWNGDSTASMSNLFQCSATLIVKKVFSYIRKEFLNFSFCRSVKSTGDESNLNNIITPVRFRKSINVIRLTHQLWYLYRVDLKNRQTRYINSSHKFKVFLWHLNFDKTCHYPFLSIHS